MALCAFAMASLLLPAPSSIAQPVRDNPSAGKILATTLGETAGDTVTMTMKLGYLVLRAPGMLRLDIPLDVIEDDDSVRRVAQGRSRSRASPTVTVNTSE